MLLFTRSANKLHQTNQINHTGNTLRTDSQNYDLGSCPRIGHIGSTPPGFQIPSSPDMPENHGEPVEEGT